MKSCKLVLVIVALIAASLLVPATSGQEKLRAVCEQWYQESGEPFIALVARHGVVVIHEPFGACPRTPPS